MNPTPYKTAVHTKGATFRLILTDHRGHISEQTAASMTEWLAASTKALQAHQFDPERLEGKSNTARRKPRYLRCESICILPSGEEVPCGFWTQRETPKFQPNVQATVTPDDAPLLQLLLGGAR